MELSDGRTLGYAEYGTLRGVPVFYFHGFPGSRLEAAIVKDKLVDLDMHLVAIDRPGMGLSDYQKNRTILDFTEDVQELAENLGFENYGVLGVSGGGPYALACACKIPSENLIGCVVVSGSGSYHMTKDGLGQGEKVVLFVAKNLPWLFRVILWLQLGRSVTNMDWWEKNYSKLESGLPAKDARILNSRRVKASIIAKSIEAFRQGCKGLVTDFKLYSEDWGFKLCEIPYENKVSIFHGKLDKNVPISSVKSLSEDIPNCKTEFYPDEGHLSVLINKFEEIMQTFIDA